MSGSGPSRPETDPIETPFGAIAAGDRLDVAPGVIMIATPVPFPPGSVNAAALEDEIDGRSCWTIIDGGLRASEAFWTDLLDGPLADRPVGRVIATHHHPDHIGLSGWLAARFELPIWTTRTAWLYARMLNLDAWTEPPAEARAFFRAAGYDDAMMARYAARARFNFSVTVAPLPLGLRQIGLGDVLTIGPRRFRVAIGHGHAPEHLLLVSLSDDLVIGGDQILPRISPNIGVYPTEPEADPLADWLASCDALAAEIADDRLVLPGHGPAFRGAATRLGQIKRSHLERLDRLETFLTEPRRAVDCFDVLFGREIGAAAEGLATVETISHLNYLLHAGRIRRWRDGDVHLWRRAP